MYEELSLEEKVEYLEEQVEFLDSKIKKLKKKNKNLKEDNLLLMQHNSELETVLDDTLAKYRSLAERLSDIAERITSQSE